MNILTKYVIYKFLKYFIVIFLALELFFAGIDFLQVIHRLPNSANLQLLYLMYNSFYILTMTLPLSIAFAFIMTVTTFIKNNELTSFYALGIKPKQFIKPLVNTSIFLSLVLMFMQMTPLAYSFEQKDRIISNTFFSDEKNDIFVKYNDYFIYFEKLYPSKKSAKTVKIYRLLNENVIEIITAPKAHYSNNKWYINDAKVVKKSELIKINSSKLITLEHQDLIILDGFEPDIIKNVYKTYSNLSIIDAIETIILFQNQTFNTDKIKAVLYSQIFTPLFIVPLLLILFSSINSNSRQFNTAKYISITIFYTLFLWGSLFMLQKLSIGAVIIPEIAIILPLVLLFVVALYIYNTKNYRST